MPLTSNMTTYQEAPKRGRGRLKTFICKRREGIHVINSVTEYQISSDSDGTRTICFRNLHEAEGGKANFPECTDKKVPGYDEAKLETAGKTSGVIILEKAHAVTPEEICNYCKDRWSIEIFYDYLKHWKDFHAWEYKAGQSCRALLS